MSETLEPALPEHLDQQAERLMHGLCDRELSVATAECAMLLILAAVVQFLGLIRWPFLVPYLARTVGDPSATAAEREAVDVVFQAFNRYLGVAVGEHLGYAFTGVWSVLAGIAATESSEVPSLLGFIGIVIGAALVLCSLEFVGAHERDGWKPAAQLTPIAYIAWSLWLIATGVALLA